MAVRNGGPYLEEAIKSLFQQTYQNYELIIIDDGSTDETAKILEGLDDFRVRIITNQENLGLTRSLNLGISQARGEYIARMDADDLSLPHRLEKQLEFLENHPEYALVGTPYYQIDETGAIKSLIRVLTDDGELRAGLLQQNWFGHGSVMMRKAAVVQAGGYDERFTYAQDYDLWLRLAADHRLANLSEPLYCWRATSSCISKDKARQQQHFARRAQKRALARMKPGAGEAPCRQPEAPALPLVSVIVPTYNRPDMLVDTLKSILAQTYRNFEIIVVNDCGLDVAGIVDWLNKEGNITYVRHGRNRGLAAARNTGIRLARGKYLAYLDDDDLFHPNHLETLATFLESSDYQVAYTDALRAHQVKEHGRYATVSRDVPYSHDFNPDLLIVANQFPVLCLLHEKSCLENAGLFDESLTTHEDWDLWIRLSLYYKFFHIKKVTCEFTWRQDGSTMTNQRAADFLRTMEIIHQKYRDHLKDKPHVREHQRRFLRQSREALEKRGVKVEPEIRGPEELLEQANGAIERQDWPAAEGCLLELTRSDPDLLEPYLTLSDVLTLQGKHREAWECLRGARHLDPDAFPLLNRLGLNCRQRGDLTGAMAVYTRLWSLHPQNLEIMRQLSAVCLDLGLKQEALGCYREAGAKNPGNISLWLELAQLAKQLEDQETFAEACRQAEAIDAGHPRLGDLTKGAAPGNGGAPPSPEALPETGAPPEPVLSSIIIPVFNNLDLTRQCLESIWNYTDAPHEIIVVDNGSTDGTREYLNNMEAAGGVRVIANPTNLGFAKASNQGAQAARGDYLVFLNNDTIVQPGWLEELIACSRKYDKIGAVGAKLLFPDDTVQHAGVAFNERKLVYHIYQHYDRDHPAVNKEREFQAVTAACMLMKKEVFFEVGAFDEGYLNGFEDVDLCFKLREQGYKIVYTPRPVVYHLESKTPGRHDRNSENSRLLRSKWSDRIIGDDHKYYEEDGIIIEILDRQGNVATIQAHDSNDNPFWREGARYREAGLLDQAEASYLRAVRFNPFDPRKLEIARELAELYESRDKQGKIRALRQLVPALAHYQSLRGGVSEARENAGAAWGSAR
jgi:GT2 family glycosyltransferase/Tfp pilus assembly protein PilF